MVVEVALPAAFVILAAVVLPAFVALPAVMFAVGLNGAPGVPWPDRVVVLPAFVALPAAVFVALPAAVFVALPAAVLFIMPPAEVVLPDFIGELLLGFPAFGAAGGAVYCWASTEAAPEVASIIPVVMAIATARLLYVIFSIIHRA
jgi:hypothetical protein